MHFIFKHSFHFFFTYTMSFFPQVLSNFHQHKRKRRWTRKEGRDKRDLLEKVAKKLILIIFLNHKGKILAVFPTKKHWHRKKNQLLIHIMHDSSQTSGRFSALNSSKMISSFVALKEERNAHKIIFFLLPHIFVSALLTHTLFYSYRRRKNKHTQGSFFSPL